MVVVVLVSGILAAIVGLLAHTLWEHRQQQNKLVPLLIDYLDHDDDLTINEDIHPTYHQE